MICRWCGHEGKSEAAKPYRYKNRGRVLICSACKGVK